MAGGLVLAGIARMAVPFFDRHGTGPPLPHSDSVILEYIGWHTARGHTLYTDIWEIKPPLAFLPTHLYLPLQGFKAKILLFAVGMAALERAVADRHLASGVLGGLVVGLWQLALIFPIMTTGFAARTRSKAVLKRHLSGFGVASIVVGATILLYADLGGLVAGVVLTPLLMETGGGIDLQTYYLYFPDDVGRWLTLFGAIGFALTLFDARRRETACPPHSRANARPSSGAPRKSTRVGSSAGKPSAASWSTIRMPSDLLMHPVAIWDCLSTSCSVAGERHPSETGTLHTAPRSKGVRRRLPWGVARQ